MTTIDLFELIGLAFRGEADCTDAVDALMVLKTKFRALAEVEGNVTISKGLATLPDGSTLSLVVGE
jgi:hypothetical protein